MICAYKGEGNERGIEEKEKERGRERGRQREKEREGGRERERERGRRGERERRGGGGEESLHIHHNLAEEHVLQSQHCIRIVDGVKAFKCFVEIRKCCFKVFFFSMKHT